MIRRSCSWREKKEGGGGMRITNCRGGGGAVVFFSFMRRFTGERGALALLAAVVSINEPCPCLGNWPLLSRGDIENPSLLPSSSMPVKWASHWFLLLQLSQLRRLNSLLMSGEKKGIHKREIGGHRWKVISMSLLLLLLQKKKKKYNIIL